MDWFRNAIGLTTASYPQSQPQITSTRPEANAQENSATLLRKKKLQLGTLKDDIEDLQREIEEAGDAGNTTLAASKIQRRNQLQKEARLLEGQIRNHEDTQRVIENASANREQALLMRNGANQLDSIVNETERIDLDEIVDTMQDAAARTQDFSSRLSEPLFSSDAYASDDVNEEVKLLMERKADEKTATSHISAYSPKVIPSAKEPKTTQVATKRVVPKTELKEKDN